MLLRFPTVFLMTVSSCSVLVGQGDVPDFEGVIRPILNTHCVSCHGNGPRIKGGLRLTHGTFLEQGGLSGSAIDRAQPLESRLLAMVSYRDEHHRMPPAGKLPEPALQALSHWVRAGAPWPEEPVPEVEPEEAGRLGRGDGREGWSYQPLVRPEIPDGLPGESTHPVDRFIQARLRSQGLSRGARADRATLLRRVSFDLLGLPPTPEEVAAFVADDRPDAWERVVDELLERPQYAEHWARHWLDVVRYAETNGYERDSDKPFAWRYRDWVVRAFQEDMPYDRFLTAQIAGDELDAPTPDDLIATGYLRLMQWDDEPGQGALQGRFDVLDDVASTTAEAFLGMTMGCARCHDHKGDPIPQEDYAGFVAWFVGMTNMSTNDCTVSILSEPERSAREEALQLQARDEAEVRAALLALEGAFRLEDAGGEGEVRSPLSDLRYRFYRDTFSDLPEFDRLRPESEGSLPAGWIDLGVASRQSAIGVVFEGNLVVPRSGRWNLRVASRERPKARIGEREVLGPQTGRREGPVWVGTVDLEAGTHPFRLDYWNGEEGFGLNVSLQWADRPQWRYVESDPGPGFEQPGFDDRAWSQGPGGFGQRGTPGSRIGTPWTSKDLWLRRTFEGIRADDLALLVHHDDDVEVWINGVPALKRSGYLVEYQLFTPSPESRQALGAGLNTLAVHVWQDFGGQYVDVVPVSVSELGAPLPSLAAGEIPLTLPPEIRGSEAFVRRMESHGPKVLGAERFARWQALRTSLEQIRKRPIPEDRRALAVVESGPTAPIHHVHIRGNAHATGPEVRPRTPRCLDPVCPPPPDPVPLAHSTGRRRALAEWLAHPENPLTPRVMVNRIWQHHFGRGLVRSSSDFGELGDRPTHPELLDWLALEFVRSGYSVKSLHRLLLLSETWCQVCREDPVGLEQDPGNDLFWRFERRRLSAEEVRDAMLSVAGILNLEMAGPSFYSEMPAAVLATSSTPDRVWGKSPEDQVRRRSLYIKVKRSLMTPVLAQFDAADTDKSCPVRFNTTTPTQSLHALNGDFSGKIAAALATRLEQECPDDAAERIRRGWSLATGRVPTTETVERQLQFLAELGRDGSMDDDRQWQFWARFLLNYNGFFYID